MSWLGVLAGAIPAAVVAALARRRGEALRARVATATRDLEALQHAFARFAPSTVVDDIIAQGLSTQAEAKEVTVVFADLRSFTALAETLPPERLVPLLNAHFESMQTAITAHRGHLAKLIGDGLLALFGALEQNPWHTNDAVHAALAMRQALARDNDARRTRGAPSLGMGVGVHRGMVVAGVIGTSRLMEYGVIGATVNLAARVQALTRRLDADILVTGAVRDALDPAFRLRPMPVTTVKGISVDLPTWAVDGFGAP